MKTGSTNVSHPPISSHIGEQFPFSLDDYTLNGRRVGVPTISHITTVYHSPPFPLSILFFSLPLFFILLDERLSIVLFPQMDETIIKYTRLEFLVRINRPFLYIITQRMRRASFININEFRMYFYLRC